MKYITPLKKQLLTALFFLLLTQYSLNATNFTWIGGNGDWHDAWNWDQGSVPYFGDVAYIPNGTVSITNNAKCESVIIDPLSVVQIEYNGGLYIHLESSIVALTNGGNITARGPISIAFFGSASSIPFAIDNFGRITTEGSINILPGFARGINNQPEGDIILDGPVDIQANLLGIFNDGIINNTHILTIHDVGSGILNRGNSEFFNYGTIELQDFGGYGSSGISNSAIFKNVSSGIININNMSAGAHTLSNYDSNAVFTNKGVINIENCSPGSLISANGLLFLNDRYADINIDNNSSTALSTSIDGTFRNKGDINVTNNGGDLTSNYGFFVNHQKGKIIADDFVTGVVVYTGSTMLNYGLIQLTNETSRAAQINGVFANRPMGTFISSQDIFITSNGTFTNQGHTVSNYNEPGSVHPFLGTCNNTGVFGDINEKLNLLNVNNTSIIVKPINDVLTEGVAVNNALELGSFNSATVLSWYTTSSGNTIAGTYNASNNTFTPNANAVGLTEVWVRIKINQGNRKRRHKVKIPNGIQSSGSNFTSKGSGGNTINTDTRSSEIKFNVYPNPTSDYLIVDISNEIIGNYEMRLFDQMGRLVLENQLQSSKKEKIQVPNSIAKGNYWLIIYRNEEQVKKQNIVIQ